MCIASKNLRGIWKFCNKQDTFPTLLNGISHREQSSCPEIVKEVCEFLALCVLCVIPSVPGGPALFLGLLRYMAAHVICKTERQDPAVSFSQQEK